MAKLSLGTERKKRDTTCMGLGGRKRKTPVWSCKETCLGLSSAFKKPLGSSGKDGREP